MCYFELKSPTDAYEVSFVAVPAQPKAGTTKNYGPDQEDQENEEVITENNKENTETDQEETKNNNFNEQDLISLKMKTIKSFIFAKKKFR